MHTLISGMWLRSELTNSTRVTWHTLNSPQIKLRCSSRLFLTLSWLSIVEACRFCANPDCYFQLVIIASALTVGPRLHPKLWVTLDWCPANHRLCYFSVHFSLFKVLLVDVLCNIIVSNSGKMEIIMALHPTTPTKF